ncbi:MAG: alkaline phosphatase [Limnochordia bacterium]|nr:alkaline phosphatase [Limnochordia bacterium]
MVVVAADHETDALSIGKDYAFDPVLLRQNRASSGCIARLLDEDRSNAIEIMEEYAGIRLTDDGVALIQIVADSTRAVGTIFNDRIGVIWGSGNHSGEMLPLSAHGADAHLFAGFYDNTDIPKKIAEAVGLDF